MNSGLIFPSLSKINMLLFSFFNFDFNRIFDIDVDFCTCTCSDKLS